MKKKVTQHKLTKRLKESRKKIDLIDQKILDLLNQRLRIALEIGRIKKEMGEKIYEPGREKEIIERLRLRNEGPLKEGDLETIFRTIVRLCRRSQK